MSKTQKIEIEQEDLRKIPNKRDCLRKVKHIDSQLDQPKGPAW